jgi:hypothetical protein
VNLTIGHLTTANFKDARRLGRFLGVRARSRGQLAARLYERILKERLRAAPVLSLPAAPWGRDHDR